MSGFQAITAKLHNAASQVGGFDQRASRLQDAARQAIVGSRSFGLIGQATVHSSYEEMVADFGEYLKMIGAGTARIEELLKATAAGYQGADDEVKHRLDAIGRKIAGGQ